MPEKTKRTKTRDLEKTRQRILKAGREEFSKYGLSGARVDRIAKNSNSNKAMIYYIFGGKDELYLAALESLWEEKSQQLDPTILAENLSVENLPMVLSAAMELFAKNKDATRMLLFDIMGGAKFLRKLRKKRPDLFTTFDAISSILDGLKQKQVVREDVDSDKAVFLTAILIAFFPILYPHMDILREKGTQQHENLSDKEQWNGFLGKLLVEAIRK